MPCPAQWLWEVSALPWSLGGALPGTIIPCSPACLSPLVCGTRPGSGFDRGPGCSTLRSRAQYGGPGVVAYFSRPTSLQAYMSLTVDSFYRCIPCTPTPPTDFAVSNAGLQNAFHVRPPRRSTNIEKCLHPRTFLSANCFSLGFWSEKKVGTEKTSRSAHAHVNRYTPSERVLRTVSIDR